MTKMTKMTKMRKILKMTKEFNINKNKFVGHIIDD